jgi:peptidyl-prolyl cis-trans isomerase SurA
MAIPLRMEADDGQRRHFVQADSGRYELAQIPNPDKNDPWKVRCIRLFTNKTADNTVSFSYILHVYRDRSPRNFRDARGFVINDYQNWLEDQWIAELKKKYPVKVDEKGWRLPKAGWVRLARA